MFTYSDETARIRAFVTGQQQTMPVIQPSSTSTTPADSSDASPTQEAETPCGSALDTNLKISTTTNNAVPKGDASDTSSVGSNDTDYILPPMKTNSRSMMHFLMFNDVYAIVPNYNNIGGLAEMSSAMKRVKQEIEGYEVDRTWKENCLQEPCRGDTNSEDSNISSIDQLNKNVLTILSGDFMSASSLALKHKGKHMIDILNQMDLDFVVPGNHEFDFGYQVTKERIKESNFTWLASNIIEEKTGEVLENCGRIKVVDTKEGFRIGMFGVCTADTVWLSKPNKDAKEGEKILFMDVIETSRKIVKELREEWKCDVLVALTHLSIHDDRKLAKAVPEIDVCLGGHDHTPITVKQGKTLIHKAGSDAEYLTHLKLYLEKVSSTVKGQTIEKVKVYHEWHMISNHSENHPDPKVAEVVQKYMKELPADNKEEIAIFLNDVTSSTESVRSKETTFANFVADAVLDQLKPELVLINGGTLRGDRNYDSGTRIKKEDLRAEMPFGGHFQLGKISGKDLRGAIEDGLSRAEQTLGSFPHFSRGVSVEFDVEKEPGSRVLMVTLNGEQLEPNREYLLASTDYLFAGGDSYKHLKNAKHVPHKLEKKSMSEVVIKYCMEKKQFEPAKEGRVFQTGKRVVPMTERRMSRS